MSLAKPLRRTSRRGRLEEIPTERRVESFADDLNTRLGIVSGRVALLPRSTEIQPKSLRFDPPPTPAPTEATGQTRLEVERAPRERKIRPSRAPGRSDRTLRTHSAGGESLWRNRPPETRGGEDDIRALNGPLELWTVQRVSMAWISPPHPPTRAGRRAPLGCARVGRWGHRGAEGQENHSTPWVCPRVVKPGGVPREVVAKVRAKFRAKIPPVGPRTRECRFRSKGPPARGAPGISRIAL